MKHQAQSPPLQPPSPRRPGRAGLVAAAVISAVLLALGGAGELLESVPNPFQRESVDRSQPSVLKALEDLNEYRAALGRFQVVVDLEERNRFIPPVIKGQRTTFLATGEVSAVVDLGGLSEGAVEVSDDRRRARVTLAPAHLSEPRIDPEHSYVLDRDRGLVDRIGGVFSDNPTSERQLYLLAAQKLDRAAREAGLVERAEHNTRATVRSVLGSLGFTEVTVVFGDHPPT